MSAYSGGARDPDVVLLMTTWSDGEAEIVRHLLEAYGIPCQVTSDITHAVSPISIDGLGEVRILVPASAYEEAARLLEDHRRRGIESAPREDADEEEGDGPSSERDRSAGDR